MRVPRRGGTAVMDGHHHRCTAAPHADVMGSGYGSSMRQRDDRRSGEGLGQGRVPAREIIHVLISKCALNVSVAMDEILESILGSIIRE